MNIKQLKWLWHPIFLFIMAQICWGLLIFVWIRWYILRSEEINALIQKIPFSAPPSGQWIILLQGCILMAFLLIALYIIFVSQRRLSRLTKMQDAILSSVTHELKTPLASIKLYTETMLMRDVGPAERAKFLQRTLQEAERLQRLTDTVLISARLESTMNHSSLSRINVRDICYGCVQRSQERFGEQRKITYESRPDDARPFLMRGDAYHIDTLFNNLLDNAIKFTRAGGEIHLLLQEHKEEIHISVRDNGIGIDKEDLKKIFNKFYRVESPAKFKISGSGLGLAVCRSIVREHGGKLFATSEGQDKGSTFHVIFKKSSSHR